VERPLTQQEVKRLRDITSANGANLKLLNDLGVEAGLRYMKAAPPPGVFDPAGLSRASAAS
jgi:hypothetical protein